MVIGKPKKTKDYICVDSKTSLQLHKLGFIPMYRDVLSDSIYFYKDEEISKVVLEWNFKIK